MELEELDIFYERNLWNYIDGSKYSQHKYTRSITAITGRSSRAEKLSTGKPNLEQNAIWPDYR